MTANWESSVTARAHSSRSSVVLGHSGAMPPVHALGLFEPLSQPIPRSHHGPSRRVAGGSGEIRCDHESLEATVDKDLAAAIKRIRPMGTVEANLPYGLANLLNPSDALFLSQADKFDPEVLAGDVAEGTPVLLTCSNDDIQVIARRRSDRVGAGIRRGGGAPRLRPPSRCSTGDALQVDPASPALDLHTKRLPVLAAAQNGVTHVRRQVPRD